MSSTRHVTYLGNRLEIGEFLDEVVGSIPNRKERDWLLARVCVDVVGESQGHGQTIPLSAIQPSSGFEQVTADETWLIILDEQELRHTQADEARTLVAHEFAHAYLGLGASHPEVAEQTASWGFSGRGADPDAFR